MSTVAAAVTELVAVGAVDAHLQAESGAATHWRMNFSKVAPFALNQEMLKASGSACCHCNYDEESSHTFQVPRSADLISKTFARFNLPGLASVDADGKEIVADEAEQGVYGADFSVVEDGDQMAYYKQSVGHLLIKRVELSIGNSKIDELSGELMECMLELSGRAGHRKGLDEMIGRADSEAELKSRSRAPQELYVELPFYFSKASGLSLPVVALQFHDIQFELNLRSIKDCIANVEVAKARLPAYGDDGNLTRLSADLASFPELSAAKYPVHMQAIGVYLGQQERVRMASAKSEILIQQSQAQMRVSLEGRESLDIKFNHAVSEMILAVPRDGSGCDFRGHTEELTGASREALESFHLSLNNQNRTPAGQNAAYYRLVQPLMHHASIPRATGIYSLSFALLPDMPMPSGSINMSRIDDIELHLKAGSGAGRGSYLHVFAKSWNVLRISLGISGLGFSY